MNNGGTFVETLRLFNFATGSFEEFRTDTVNTGYQILAVSGSGDLTRYIGSSGALQTQLQIKQTGFSAIPVPCCNIEHVEWLLAP